MNFKGAIFDMDGTILDSMQMWQRIDSEFLIRRGLNPTAEFRAEMGGMGLEAAADYVIRTFSLPDSPEEIMAAWEQQAIDYYKAEVTPKPFAREYLQFLRKNGVSTALATASREEFYRTGLQRVGFYDYFDCFTVSSEVARPKGFPDVYIRAAEKMGLAPHECVVFEDIYKAVKAAKDGGFFTVAIEDDAAEEEREQIRATCDLYIKSYEELLEIPLFASAAAAHGR